MKSPPAYPTTKARAGVKLPKSVNPNSFMAKVATNPTIPESTIIPEKYFHLKGTFLYENWCLMYPTNPLKNPPPNAAMNIYVIISNSFNGLIWLK